MNSWDCSLGISDRTVEIAPLQKANTTFLSLAAATHVQTGDANVYIMFDSGSGLQVEEWIMPRQAGLPWDTSNNVTVDFQL